MLDSCRILRVDAFPQHIDADSRVFEDANLTTCIFVCKRDQPDEAATLTIRAHPAGEVLHTTSFATPRVALIRSLDPDGLAIPACSPDEWRIVEKLARSPLLEKLGERNTSYQGEVNETIHRSCLREHGQGSPVLRGAHVCRYTIRESWRQNDLFLDETAFLHGRDKVSKAFHHRYARVGFQRSAPQNNFRRLIAAPIPRGAFCFDTVSYFLPDACSLSAPLLLALLNSELLDWYFDLGSTNSKVNEYRLTAAGREALKGMRG